MQIMPHNSLLAQKPLKQIPKGIIYRISNSNVYKLADVRNCEYVGRMIAGKKPSTKFYNLNPFTNDVLHIYSLEIKNKHIGWGTCLLNHAKRESYTRGCEGRLTLGAYNPRKSPHTFYRKNGFVCEHKYMDKYLDKCIANNIIPSHLPLEEMYLPINIQTNKSTRQKIREFFSRFLRTIIPIAD
jgi:hypothetical protein